MNLGWYFCGELVVFLENRSEAGENQAEAGAAALRPTPGVYDSALLPALPGELCLGAPGSRVCLPRGSPSGSQEVPPHTLTPGFSMGRPGFAPGNHIPVCNNLAEALLPGAGSLGRQDCGQRFCSGPDLGGLCSHRRNYRELSCSMT